MDEEVWLPDSPETIRRIRRMVVITTVVGVLIILAAVVAFVFSSPLWGTVLFLGGCFPLCLAQGLRVDSDERGCIWAGVGILFGLACTGVIVWAGVRYLFG